MPKNGLDLEFLQGWQVEHFIWSERLRHGRDFRQQLCGRGGHGEPEVGVTFALVAVGDAGMRNNPGHGRGQFSRGHLGRAKRALVAEAVRVEDRAKAPCYAAGKELTYFRQHGLFAQAQLFAHQGKRARH